MKDVGVYVSPRDPEYARIQRELENPNGSLAKTIRAAGVAAEAKKARLQQAKQNAQARTMSGGGQTADPKDISGITDSKELYRLGSQQMAGGRKP